MDSESTSPKRGRPPLGQERELAPFGRNLRAALRQSRFKNRQHFLRAMGLEKQGATIHRYELGEREPPASLVQNFAVALGVSVETLLAGDARAPVTDNDTLGWTRFVRAGMREHYLARGLTEQQLDWVRAAPGRDAQSSLGWYVELCELLVTGLQPHPDFERIRESDQGPDASHLTRTEKNL